MSAEFFLVAPIGQILFVFDSALLGPDLVRQHAYLVLVDINEHLCAKNLVNYPLQVYVIEENRRIVDIFDGKVVFIMLLINFRVLIADLILNHVGCEDNSFADFIVDRVVKGSRGVFSRLYRVDNGWVGQLILRIIIGLVKSFDEFRKQAVFLDNLDMLAMGL